MARKRLGLVCFGDRDEWYAQSYLAILTALGWTAAPVEVVVATDHPERYRWFGDRVAVEPLTFQRIDEWSGPQRFVWRLVLKALVECARRDPPADFLYVDVDTLARRPLDDLFVALHSGHVFLDRRESVLRRRGGEHRQLWNQVRGRTFAGFRIDERTEMWNSGVVGVGTGNVHLLSQALELCDAITGAGVKSRLVEQLSQSVVLRSTGRLREAAPWIDHYWGNKPAYDAAVYERLAKILVCGLDLERAIELARDHPIRKPLRVKPRWWHRHLRRLAGA
jgi:hypothetical protein